MNQHVSISYEETLKARAREVRSRLFGKPKVVNVLKEVLAHKEEYSRRGKILDAEPDEHVKAFYIWQQYAFKRTTMNEYADTLCQSHGTSLSAVRSMRRARALTFILDTVAFEMKAMFPHKPLSEIGRVLNRDHSSICRGMEREALRRGIKPREMMSADYPEIEELLRSGKTIKEIAAFYDVGASTISRKISAMGLSDLLQVKTKPASMDFIESVRSEYAAGASQQSLGEKYGISVRTVLKWKRAFNWQRDQPMKAREP
jgi:transposase